MVDAATDALRSSLRASASAKPDGLAQAAKDVGILVKLIRNPAEQPADCINLCISFDSG